MPSIWWRMPRWRSEEIDQHFLDAITAVPDAHTPQQIQDAHVNRRLNSWVEDYYPIYSDNMVQWQTDLMFLPHTNVKNETRFWKNRTAGGTIWASRSLRNERSEWDLRINSQKGWCSHQMHDERTEQFAMDRPQKTTDRESVRYIQRRRSLSEFTTTSHSFLLQRNHHYQE